MRERFITSLITAIVISGINAQNVPAVPKLVIGLTIDQLRTDYIEAFSAMYGERGFKRLFREGRVYMNGEYDFIKPDQSSSVASIYTGTTPYYNGVVGNNWMDRNSLCVVKSVDDKSYMGVYTSENVSPKYLTVSNLADELMVSTHGQAHVYSIAPTKEMAIMGAGHAAKGAFWINDKTGKWSGTTYYGTFPEWVTNFNDRNGLDFRIDQITWGPYLPVTAYKYITTETKQLTFKHNFTDERLYKYKKFKTSPYVNDEVNKLVDVFLNNTNAGLDDTPDLLTLGYYAGNYDGKPDNEYAMQIQDMYVRLDNTIGDLLDMLDRKVGLKNTLIFITSTGYRSPEPEDLPEYRIPTGEFHLKRCSALLNMYLMAIYGQGQYVETYYGNQIYLNHKLIEDKNLNITEVMTRSSEFIVQMSGIRSAYSSQRLLLGAWDPKIEKIRNSFTRECSGDLYIEILPGWKVVDEYSNSVRVEREAYSSVPVFFFGYNIKPEILYSPVKVSAVAPTLAHFMRIRAPNASVVAPLTGIRK